MGAGFGRWSGILALALSVAAAGCGGGGDDEDFPPNTLEIDRVQVAVDPPVDVSYFDDQRWVAITDADGAVVELAFEGIGASSELPLGHFTQLSADFVSVRVCVPHQACRSYTAPGQVNGTVEVDGDARSRLIAIAGGLALDNGTDRDEVIFSYGGAYTFEQD